MGRGFFKVAKQTAVKKYHAGNRTIVCGTYIGGDKIPDPHEEDEP